MKIALKKPHPHSRYKKQTVIIVVLICLLTTGLVLANHVNLKQKNTSSQKFSIPTPIPIPQKVNDLLTNIGHHISLPPGETPSVATVTDVNKLPQEPFFAQAQNGDKVLIYAMAKKAYLYRPSTGKIIEKSAVENVNDIPQNATSSAETSTDSAYTTHVLKVKY